MSAIVIPLYVKTGQKANIAAANAEANELIHFSDTHELFIGVGTGSEPVPLKLSPENLIDFLVDGKIQREYIPEISITDVYTVGSTAERDALTVQTGDTVIILQETKDESGNTVTDDNGNPVIRRIVDMYDGTQYQTIFDSDVVNSAGYAMSVNGVNPVNGDVAIDTDNVSEGNTNLYFTTGRVSAYIATRLNKASGIAGLDADGLLSISQFPAEVVQEGDVITRLATTGDPEHTFYAADGNGGWLKGTAIDGGTF